MFCSLTLFYSPLFWWFLGHPFVFMRMHEMVIFCGCWFIFSIITMRKQLQ